MPDVTGLTPPPAPQPGPAPIARTPDLQAVGQGLANVLQTANAGLPTDVSIQLRGQPYFHGFSGADAGAFGKIQSSTEQTGYEVFSQDTTVNTFEKLWHYLGEKFFRPIASTADQGIVENIRKAQKEFFDNHGTELKQMDDSANSAMGKMAELGRFLDGQPTSQGQFSGHLPDNDITGIMKKKTTLGNDLSSQINGALAAATDPDDQAKLKSMKNDLDSWMKDRDNRVKGEWPQASSLQGAIDTMNTEISRQRSSLLKAGDANFALANKQRPYLMTPTGTSAGETNLMTPDVAQYMASLRNSLLQGRTQFTSLLTAWSRR